MDLICNYMCEPKSRNYLGYVTLLSMKAKKAMNIKGETLCPIVFGSSGAGIFVLVHL